jgi:hypothetical protein
MLIINKSKHPKKGEYKEQNGRTHVQKDKKSTKKKQTKKGPSSFQTLYCHEKHIKQGKRRTS